MIHLRNLKVRYGQDEILKDVNLDVEAGECLLITGPSGCGKTTLARVLSGLIPHAVSASVEGDVRVAGLDLLSLGLHPLAEVAQRVSVVLQNPSSQLFHLRVEDEVGFGPRNLGLREQEVRGRVDWALEAVGIGDLAKRKPAGLSCGQQQRVAIAAALAMRPEVLVLDEPTASLDVTGTNHVISTLAGLKKSSGISIVLIEHRLAEAVRLADRMVVMNEGRVVADGAANEILENRRLLRELGLRRPTEEPPAPWETLLHPDGNTQKTGGPPVLEMRQVSAGYGRDVVLRGLDLALHPGEFTAVVGDNGSGKTTLARVAGGLLKPSGGEVVFHHETGSGRSWGRPRLRPGLDVALLFQNPADQLFTDSVEEEVAFGPLNYRRFDAARHERLLEESDLVGLRSRLPMALSAGQQQRTALAACLSLLPRLVILDEPTLGQDWRHLQRLMDFLRELNRQGMAILLITHDYKLVHRYAHRVVWMDGGRIVLDGHLRHAGRGAA